MEFTGMKYKTLTADLLLLFVAITWGSTFVIVKNAVDFLPPFSFNGVRFTLAAAFLLFVLLLFYRDVLRTINKKMILTGSLVGVLLFGGYALQTFGLLYTTASKAGFITGLSVVMVPLFAIIFFKEQIRRQAAIGITLATIGLLLLSVSSDWSIAYGDFLVFLCAICYALHIIFLGKWAPRYPALALAFIQITAAAVLNLVFALLFEDFVHLQPETLLVPDVMWALLITAFFSTALAFLIQTAAQKFTTPTKTALILATEPVFAAISGYLFAHEILATREWVGCLMILLGMIVAEWKSSSERKIHAAIQNRNLAQKSHSK